MSTDIGLSSEARAAASVMLGGTMRRTVRTLAAQGQDAETIAAALDLPVEVVQQAMPEPPGPPTENSRQEISTNLRQAERSLGEMQPRAIEVLGEVLEYGDSSSVKLAAAKLIIEGANGAFRPKVVEQNNTVQQINLVFQQATEVYREQLARINAIQSNPNINV